LSAKFTPGPLTVQEVTGGFCLKSAAVGEGYYGHVGLAVQRDKHPRYGGEVARETAEANAKLWAAAPALLDALKRAVFLLHDGWDGCSEDSAGAKAIRQAEDAIAKAEGR